MSLLEKVMPAKLLQEYLEDIYDVNLKEEDFNALYGDPNENHPLGPHFEVMAKCMWLRMSNPGIRYGMIMMLGYVERALKEREMERLIGEK